MGARENIYRYLDVTGDGTGSTDGAVDGSSTPVLLKYLPTATVKIERMLVYIRDGGGFRAEYYGSISAGITNGITVKTYDQSVEDVDLTAGLAVKTNADWARLCYDATRIDFGSGDNFLSVRWTFSKSGRPLTLDNGDELRVTLADDFSDLVEHRFMIQGYRP